MIDSVGAGYECWHYRFSEAVMKMHRPGLYSYARSLRSQITHVFYWNFTFAFTSQSANCVAIDLCRFSCCSMRQVLQFLLHNPCGIVCELVRNRAINACNRAAFMQFSVTA